MTHTVAVGIADTGYENGLDMEARQYSGRKMFGKEVWAVSCDDLGDFLMAVAQYGYRLGRKTDFHAADDLESCVQNIRQDSLGKGLIFY